MEAIEAIMTRRGIRKYADVISAVLFIVLFILVSKLFDLLA